MHKSLILIPIGALLVLAGVWLQGTDPHAILSPSPIKTPTVSQKAWDIPESTGGLALYESARKQIGVTLEYDHTNGYYAGGEPPPYTGVCTDVISRAFSGV